MTIAILDDQPERITQMRGVLAERLPEHRTVEFDNAPDMIAWLDDRLSNCSLICLDHDLGSERRLAGGLFDPGTGRDVADYLAVHSPTCPVLIHTTNSLAVPGMELVLSDAGWTCSRVVPYGDLQWINELWIDRVRHLLG